MAAVCSSTCISLFMLILISKLRNFITSDIILLQMNGGRISLQLERYVGKHIKCGVRVEHLIHSK